MRVLQPDDSFFATPSQKWHFYYDNELEKAIVGGGGGGVHDENIEKENIFVDCSCKPWGAIIMATNKFDRAPTQHTHPPMQNAWREQDGPINQYRKNNQ